MRRPALRTLAATGLFFTAALAIGTLAARQGQASREPAPAVIPSRLVVHEWGTFTSFSRADGVQLDFRTTSGGDLPAFVWDRARHAQYSTPEFNLSKTDYWSRQRMETPVLYFYTDEPLDVEVAVDFPGGLLTEFFPPPREVSPIYSPEEGLSSLGAFALTGGRSRLNWGSVHLIPPSRQPTEERQEADGTLYRPTLPAVTAGDHYGQARVSDSALVEVPGAPGQRHLFEKFLFYRGVGNFTLPLSVEAQGAGRFRILNYGPQAIDGLFLLHCEGETIRFTRLPRLAGNAPLYAETPTELGTLEALATAVAGSLVEAGLYEAEAQAMVNTWRDQWFSEQGTRLLYLLPGEVTEQLLPLQLNPAPQELVRVLVGRLELFTPEQAQGLANTLREVGPAVSLTNEAVSAAVASLGRFAEPALAAVRADHADLAVPVDALLAELSATTKE